MELIRPYKSAGRGCRPGAGSPCTKRGPRSPVRETVHIGGRASSMRIVLISLERVVERRRRMSDEFARVGLDYEVWPAVDATALTEEDREFVDHDQRSRLGLYSIPDGSLANTLSQRGAMADLVTNGPDTMAVFEDDARFDPSLPEVLAALDELPRAFDIVKLQRRNLRKPFIPSFPLTTRHRLGRVRFADFGSEGYVITRRRRSVCSIGSPEWFVTSITISPGSGRVGSTCSTSTPRSCGRTGRATPRSSRPGVRNVRRTVACGGVDHRSWRGGSWGWSETICEGEPPSASCSDPIGHRRSRPVAGPWAPVPARGRAIPAVWRMTPGDIGYRQSVMAGHSRAPRVHSQQRTWSPFHQRHRGGASDVFVAWLQAIG